MGNQEPAAARAGPRGKNREDGKNMRQFGHLTLSHASFDAFFYPPLAARLRMVFRGVSA
jgi:hypothetical protein